MADVVLDANVIVGLLDATDGLHARASALVRRLAADGHRLLYLDVCVSEAVSVICRRASERRTSPPDLAATLAAVRSWLAAGTIAFGGDVERRYAAMLDVVAASAGALNVNDALLVVLQRDGAVGAIATFDTDFANVEGLATIA